jgi:hypothetical protein
MNTTTMPAAPSMPDDSNLADLNFAEMCRTISRIAGGRVLEVDGLLLWSGAHPSPAIINGLIRTAGTLPSPEKVLDLAMRWFGEIGHGYAIHVRVGRDDDLEMAALERGFTRLIELPVMVHDGPPPEVYVPDGYSLTRVEDPQGLRDLVAAVGEPFELPAEVASVFARPEAAVAPFTGAIVVRDAGGRAVAGAWTSVSHTLAGIGFVGTLQSERRRGLGTVVTAAAMHLGFRMGATRAVLQASPMGYPVYARMGFRAVGTYRLYAHFASAH